MKEILDHELTEYAKNWAADLEDEAGRLARRADRDGRGHDEDTIRLVRALAESAAMLRGADGVMPIEPIEAERMRACAIAWAWRLRNAAADANDIALILDSAADVLELAGAAEGPGDRSDGPGATLPA